MVAMPLFSSVLSSNQPPARAAKIAAQLIESAMSELEQIEKLNEMLAPDDPLQFERTTASLVRGMYEQWAREADILLKNIAGIAKYTGPILGARAFEDAHGRTRAMLSISLDQMADARRQIVEGRLIPIEEVRRELRSKVH